MQRTVLSDREQAPSYRQPRCAPSSAGTARASATIRELRWGATHGKKRGSMRHPCWHVVVGREPTEREVTVQEGEDELTHCNPAPSTSFNAEGEGPTVRMTLK
jgi:hypothetical protein